MQDRSWSNKQMEILAQCLRDNVATPEGAPDYDDVMIWYDELAAEVPTGRLRPPDRLGSTPSGTQTKPSSILSVRVFSFEDCCFRLRSRELRDDPLGESSIGARYCSAVPRR